jgi:hypothetical protein
MTAETVRVLIASGFFMVLMLLRLEAGRFGAAEFDEPGRRQRGFLTRLSWYLIGLALVAALYIVHPQPHDVLFLLVGHRSDVVLFGAILAALGLAQAAALAWLRYGYLRYPPAAAYPGAALNSIATALIDEAAFRGALLGTLVAIGLPDGVAILVATLGYVLVTRSAAPGRHRSLLLVSLGMGLVFGWATLATGGIGAAIIGHAVASFALFVCTGHAGQVPPAGNEPDELEARRRLPEGWQDTRRPLVPGRGSESQGFAEQIELSGFVDRAERRAAEAGRSRGIVARVRGSGRAKPQPERRSAR